MKRLLLLFSAMLQLVIAASVYLFTHAPVTHVRWFLLYLIIFLSMAINFYLFVVVEKA